MSNSKRVYSIIDIETTGGRRDGHKITEIAIINFDGEKSIEEYSTLINPERNIPLAITYFTGISNEMVQDAPKFYEVAKKIVELTEGNIFVAHNVFFDFNFIKHEFQSLGYSYNREKLCTVRLARQKLPGHKSYSLGNICNDLGIEIKNRHRALGDARATVELLKKILESDNKALVQYTEVEGRKVLLPSKLDREDYDKLPNLPGVYYFYDDQGKLLYIGKSKDIKKRVASHFRLDMKRPRDIKLKNEIAKIEYSILGSELSALLYECHEIKNRKPVFNISMRRKNFPIGIEIQENKEGVLELSARRRISDEDYLYTFANKKSAMKAINSMYKTFLGHEKDSLHFETARNKMISIIGIQNYNHMLNKLFTRKDREVKNYKLKMQGRIKNEICLIEVVDHHPKFLCFYDESSTPEEGEFFNLNSDPDMQKILIRYLSLNPSLKKLTFK